MSAAAVVTTPHPHSPLAAASTITETPRFTPVPTPAHGNCQAIRVRRSPR